MIELTGLSHLVLLGFALAVFFAAVVRGFTGFGFSALTVSSLFFIVPVQEIVPVVYVLEVAASIQTVVASHKQDAGTLSDPRRDGTAGGPS